MLAITTVTAMSAAHPNNKRASVGKRLEKQVAKLSAMRGQMEQRRRKKLWEYANACDAMVKEELEYIESLVGQPTQVEDEDDVHVEFKTKSESEMRD